MDEVVRPYVVVGVDGSPYSVVAAEYAAGWAAGHGLDLHLVHGYLHPFGHGVGVDPYPSVLPPPPLSGDRMLHDVADRLRAARPGLAIVTRQVPAGPSGALVEESRFAELTVVGSRGHGGVAGMLLRSVAAAVAAHGSGPVIVVHGGGPNAAPARIVVGVDGSPGSAHALAFAFATAEHSRAKIVAVHVWWADPVEALRHRGHHVPADLEAAAGALLAAAVEPWRATYGDLGLVEKLVHGRNPAEVLIDESALSDLVVVGARGHGGFVGLLLGSVTSTVVPHARCAVAVARPHSHRAG